MRFNKLDLNLLVALDALLRERSVTRAAERLHMSPSAMSSSLARLRTYFDDELLVPIGRGMEATPRALDLQEAVRDVLLRVESTIALQPAFRPDQSDRSFRIYASDYTQVVLLPHLLALARAQASTVRLEICQQVALPQRDLERGDADLLVIPSGLVSPRHPSEVLFHERFVCIAAQDGPLAEGPLTMDRYLAAGHVVMEPPGRVAAPFESEALALAGVRRRVAVSTYSFAAMPALVAGSPYLATVHQRLAQRFAASWPLVVHPAPLTIGPMAQAMQWHRYRSPDPGLVWLRQLALAAARRMDAADATVASPVAPAASAAQ